VEGAAVNADLATSVLAAEGGGDGFTPPGLHDFVYAPLITLFGGSPAEIVITKITVLVGLSVVLIAAFFFWAYANPKVVPTKKQWVAESTYGFIRDGVAREIIGHEGIRFAPYLTSLFLFILVNNLWGVIPLAQISPNSRIAYPFVLATISLVVYHWVGIRKQGFVKYWRDILFMPGVPAGAYLILTPIELLTYLVTRPVTLAIRLFANMFAGHLLLLVATLGGLAMLNSAALALKIASPFVFLFAIVLTLFEFFIAALQAYVFAVLNASYISGALAEEH
jgi:F-type H+-transporting ATPase subunit a